MAASTPKTDPLHIHAAPDAQFVLHPDDNDVFVRTGRQIIEGRRLSISIAVWLDELKEMFSHVRDWCAGRQDKIRACVAVARGSKILLFFVPTTPQFHFDLADELAEFNRELVTTFNIGMVEIGQIPATEIDRFLDIESARVVYGAIEPASVEA